MPEADLQIVIDVSTIGAGWIKTGVTAYLEICGERYALETVHTVENAKKLVTKWQTHSQQMNAQFNLTEAASHWSGT